MRVTRGEARIYPTVTFEAQPSDYVSILQTDRGLQHFAFTEIKNRFEFLVNSQFLSARHAQWMTFWRTAQVGAIDLNRPGASGKPPVPAKRQALAEQLALRAGQAV